MPPQKKVKTKNSSLIARISRADEPRVDAIDPRAAVSAPSLGAIAPIAEQQTYTACFDYNIEEVSSRIANPFSQSVKKVRGLRSDGNMDPRPSPRPQRKEIVREAVENREVDLVQELEEVVKKREAEILYSKMEMKLLKKRERSINSCLQKSYGRLKMILMHPLGFCSKGVAIGRGEEAISIARDIEEKGKEIQSSVCELSVIHRKLKRLRSRQTVDRLS